MVIARFGAIPGVGIDSISESVSSVRSRTTVWEPMQFRGHNSWPGLLRARLPVSLHRFSRLARQFSTFDVQYHTRFRYRKNSRNSPGVLSTS